MVAQDAACPVWVHFNGKQYCSPTLERAQQDANGLKYVKQLYDGKCGFDKRQGLRKFYHLIDCLPKAQTGQDRNQFFTLILHHRYSPTFMRPSERPLETGRPHIEFGTGHPLFALPSPWWLMDTESN